MIDVVCDYCQTDHDSPEWTVAQARESARRDGWRTRAGRDICPECLDGAA